jgi:hypothetical protein
MYVYMYCLQRAAYPLRFFLSLEHRKTSISRSPRKALSRLCAKEAHRAVEALVAPPKEVVGWFVMSNADLSDAAGATGGRKVSSSIVPLTLSVFCFFQPNGKCLSQSTESHSRALHTMTVGQVSLGLTRSAVQPSRSFMATSSDSRHPCAVKRKRTRFDVPKTSHRSTYWRNPWPAKQDGARKRRATNTLQRPWTLEGKHDTPWPW